ncbi:hypothetical protein T265_15359, partial [Opisthorchis viverrini]
FDLRDPLENLLRGVFRRSYYTPHFLCDICCIVELKRVETRDVHFYGSHMLVDLTLMWEQLDTRCTTYSLLSSETFISTASQVDDRLAADTYGIMLTEAATFQCPGSSSTSFPSVYRVDAREPCLPNTTVGARLLELIFAYFPDPGQTEATC